MLQELYKDFMHVFGNEAKTGAENSLDKKANNILKAACQKYDDLKKVDKMSAVQVKVDAVTTTMQDNIAKLLVNTTKAEVLAEQSDQLNEQASIFQKRSTSLRKQMAWKNTKMTLLLGGIVLVILLIIIVPIVRRS